MLSSRSNALRRGQWSLIGLLVSLAIVAILSAWYYNKTLKPAPGSHNGAPAAEQQAYGTACSEYQAQLNMASTLYKQDHGDRPPHTFDDLKKSGATDEIIRAPGCQFQLDPTTGAVTEIGHGRASLAGGAPVVLGAAPAAAPPVPPPADGAPLLVGPPTPPAPPPVTAPASSSDGGE